MKTRLGQIRCYPTKREALATADAAALRLPAKNGIAPWTTAESPAGMGYIAYVHVYRSLSAYTTAIIAGAVVVDDDGTPIGLAFEAYTDSCDSGHLEEWVEYFDSPSTSDDHRLVPT